MPGVQTKPGVDSDLPEAYEVFEKFLLFFYRGWKVVRRQGPRIMGGLAFLAVLAAIWGFLGPKLVSTVPCVLFKTPEMAAKEARDFRCILEPHDTTVGVVIKQNPAPGQRCLHWRRPKDLGLTVRNIEVEATSYQVDEEGNNCHLTGHLKGTDDTTLKHYVVAWNRVTEEGFAYSINSVGTDGWTVDIPIGNLPHNFYVYPVITYEELGIHIDKKLWNHLSCFKGKQREVDREQQAGTWE